MNPNLPDIKESLAKQYRDGTNTSARGRLHERYSTNPRGWLQWAFAHLPLPNPGLALEIGCGTGWLWDRNASRVPAGCRLLLTDLSRGMLSESRERLAKGPLRASFGQADAESLPLRDGTVDIVVANHMLYHVLDRQRAFAEIQRVLRPGGVLCAATNGTPAGPTMLDWVRKAQPDARRSEYSSMGDGGFSLENGRDQLALWFSTIQLHRFRDSLAITAVQPFVDYVQSTRGIRISEERLPEFRRIVQEEIDRSGAVRIAKSAGIFVARK